MSIVSRTTLKAQFVAGTAATATKFEDLFDSHYNKYEDSVLMGPVGETGTNGLMGPTGATFYTGLWIDSNASVPAGPTAAGLTGQTVVSGTAMYICLGSVWIKSTVETSF